MLTYVAIICALFVVIAASTLIVGRRSKRRDRAKRAARRKRSRATQWQWNWLQRRSPHKRLTYVPPEDEQA